MAPNPSFPWGHLPIMAFAWISFLMYINLIAALLRKRNRKVLTNSPVYTLLLFGSIGDILMFLHMEFIMRPRKYRWFLWYDEKTPLWVAYFSYFTLCWLRIVMILSYLPLALNRFTAFVFPVYYKKLWKPVTILLITIVIWLFALFSVILIFYYPKPVVLEFVLLENGILQIMTNNLFMRDAIEVTGFSMTISIICGVLYLAGGMAAKKLTGVESIERKMFFCCLLATAPLLGESAKACFLLNGAIQNNIGEILLATELYFYWTEIMTSVQCWSLLLITPSARTLLFRDGLLHFCTYEPRVTVSIIVSHSA